MPPTSASHRPRRRWPWLAALAVLGLAAIAWWWSGTRSHEAQGARRGNAAVVVVTARAEARDVPVRLRANGTVTAVQSVDLRSQVTATVRSVHIREGQNVKAGDLLLTLDARTEEANIRKAEAQVQKDRADLATAQRNLKRQRDLFEQKFISQAALDTVQNQVDTLNGQLAIDQAALESARVARGYTEIRAPFAGRTGSIGVRPGSLVQPSTNVAANAAPPLLTVTQIDPIAVSFTLPEKELAGLQGALATGPVKAVATPPGSTEAFTGRIVFVDNSVDTATGTIRLKAEFANAGAKLWPGMFVGVEVSPRTLHNATVVPAQAVQTGPERRFVYIVGTENKVTAREVRLAYLDEGQAVVEGLSAGARVVVEGAQNLRPGSLVAEGERSAPGATDEAAKRDGAKPAQARGASPA